MTKTLGSWFAKNPRRLLLSISIPLALTGCAVTPKPITTEERTSTLQFDRSLMYANQAPVAAGLTLEAAMEQALKNNLEHRLKLMEQALALGQIDLARFEMLPRLLATAGYYTRNNELVTDSMDVDTRQIALGNTTSQEKQRTTADLTFTWNALDFGVSYFQAQQQADRSLIMNERKRKTTHTLMQQLRHAYWLAVGAQALEGRVEPLLIEVDQALRDAERVEAEKLRPPLETLNYRKTMLDLVRQLESIRDELSQAKPRLAALMNLAPGTAFSVVVPERLTLPAFGLTLPEMEEKALLQRPELIEADLQERISVAETKKAIVRLLPGVELFAGPHYDSNRFLHNASWADAGLRVTWNLFNLLTGPRQRELAQTQVEIARMQRLAMNMAVLTQVHVSWRDFNGKMRQYELAQKMYEIDQKIFEHTQAAARNNAESRLNAIRSGASALMTDYRRYQNYAAMQATYGQVIASLGQDPVPSGFADTPSDTPPRTTNP